MSVTLDAPSADPEADRPALPARAKGRRASLLRFWPYLRPYRFQLIGATVLSSVAMLTAVLTPLVIARIVDGPIARGDFGGVVAPVLLVLVLGVIEAVGVWGRRWLLAKPATQFEITMRAKIFRELQALSIGRHDSWESGQLLSRAVDDLATLRRFIGFAGPVLVIHAVVIPVGLAVLVAMSWQIGVIFAVAAVPITIICIRFERRYAGASRRSQDQSGDLATTAEESAQGIRVLKAFGRGTFFGTHFTAQARELQRTEMYKVRLDATLWASLVVLSESILVFALGFGAYAVVGGTMSLGAAVGAITLATFLQWPIIWTGFLLAELNDAGTAADRYWEIIDTPIEITDPDHPAELPERIVGELRLDSVRFGFPGAEADVLHDISLVVRPGETVALVGATGSGKTALLNLIPRLYDVTGGAITIDGIDISTLRVRDLRSLVSVAFEDPVLFSASVRENVALGDPDASDDDVRRALEIAQALDFVSNLPWGLDTRIGEQGLSLSGGQRQRLALARAVLTREGQERRARIVVLDDPLSALDVQTEEKVQERLRTALAGATTLLVAHRPSTAALADRVALLADGRIVAEGTHDHLLRTSSRYRELMGGER
ncbi:ABC transporter ATP-binding protein [Nocardia cyriacigeorgica]|uniref:ABC transporter ATP-binding protein n=1 Tax=Nocardia cyriacigeorgica TaxID=135487 RepID=UPI00189629FB|nr:ABC transporter ATP-binding protein [Nocardia cyriacigeorgica]MBF6160380.1 ABC transporter ATP-binding protein [Nocardia cyriacigeorgica]MBF6199465.1 ABC transporter ATP-binding protein [Nocardia cyriacigeorgica]MBF6343128.1 ABC transporter ATP-binding protein [Nocardia cyriacigeorgica]MBF6515802.1 ABC transporter ATP-binding protein [Nocardia cyriacigeorgica]